MRASFVVRDVLSRRMSEGTRSREMNHNSHNSRFATDIRLLEAARRVMIRPMPNRSVFYAEDIGKALAEGFVRRHSGYSRLDDLVKKSPEGRILWEELQSRSKNRWNEVEEIWGILSVRFASASIGNVHCFVPDRFVGFRPLKEFRHKYTTNSFVNTQFEKYELPELNSQPKINKVYFHDERKNIYLDEGDRLVGPLKDPTLPR